MERKKIYWTESTIKQQHFLFAATEKGLCYVDCRDEPFSNFQSWCHKHFTNYELDKNAEILAPYVDELRQYFSKRLTSFNQIVDLYGTCFQKHVWKQLQQIPYGETVTYSFIAKKIKNPKAVRAVANAIGKNPLLIILPCHRVIGKDGTLTGFRAGLPLKERLLLLEKKVVGDGRGKNRLI